VIRTTSSTALAAFASAAFLFVSIASPPQARADGTTWAAKAPSALPDYLGKPQTRLVSAL